MSTPFLIAHRGASTEAPENTLPAFRRALEIGVDALEVDVHLTGDGHLVAVHDAVVWRTAWGATGKCISDMSLVEVRSLDAGSWFGPQFAGEKIPTLTEVLALDRGKAGLMIELKRGHCPVEPFAQAVVDTLAAASKNSFIVGSFSAPLLEEVHRRNPALPLMGIVRDFHLLDSFNALNTEAMALFYRLVTPSLIATFHERGQEVWSFTVDELKVARFLMAIGVNGIITNRPRELRNV